MIHFFHTAPALAEVFTGLLTELAPGTEATHTLRPDLLARAIAQDAATPEIIEEAAKAMMVSDTKPSMVICTCSTIGAAADLANERSSHLVFRIDRPMAQRSVLLGQRILVLAALNTTIEPTVGLIRAESEKLNRPTEISHAVLDGAWWHLKAGNQPGYLAAVADSLAVVDGTVDVIVLAQASMAAAISRVGAMRTPVLTSPRVGLESALAVLRSGKAETLLRSATGTARTARMSERP